MSCRFIEMQCEISGSHTGAGEDSGLFGCHNISTGNKLRTIFFEGIALIFLLKHMGRLLLKVKETMLFQT